MCLLRSRSAFPSLTSGPTLGQWYCPIDVLAVNPAAIGTRQIYPRLYDWEVPSRKPIAWMGDSRARLQTAPADIRADAGYQLGLVQRGEVSEDFKPMPDVGPGVMEIRIQGDNEYRVFYVARYG